jgi:hypothetical protein
VIRRVKDGVRVLADGELKAKVTLEVAGASKHGDREDRKGRRFDQYWPQLPPQAEG